MSVITTVGTEIGMLLGAVVGGMILYGVNVLKSKIASKKEPKRESIPLMVENDVEVYKILSEVLLKSKASRALVMQFHNGTHYVNSASQMKMSCTHEVVSDGIAKVSKNMQNMLISQHAQSVNNIITNASFPVKVDDDDTEELKQLLRAQGVDFAMYAPFMRGSDIEGFIGINYLDPLVDNFPGESEEIVQDKLGHLLASCALKIGYLLRRKI